MTNIEIIENTLRCVAEATSILKEWKTKPAIPFEEQRKAAGILMQALSLVWSVTIINEQIETEKNKLVNERQSLDEYKQELRKALAGLRQELNDNPAVLGELPIKQPTATEEDMEIEWDTEKTQRLSSISAKQQATAELYNPPVSIFDTFTTHDEDEPVLATPIHNLRGAIGVTDKFLFIRELFHENEADFQQTIDRLDTLQNLKQAQDYLATVLHGIDKNSHANKQFNNLLARRYATDNE